MHVFITCFQLDVGSGVCMFLWHALFVCLYTCVCPPITGCAFMNAGVCVYVCKCVVVDVCACVTQCACVCVCAHTLYMCVLEGVCVSMLYRAFTLCTL